MPFLGMLTKRLVKDLNQIKDGVATPGQLISILAPYCIEKMEANAHKKNPFYLGFVYLHQRELEEAEEKREAMVEYMDNPTEANAEAYLKEIADQMNFLMFQAGKVLGLKGLRR